MKYITLLLVLASLSCNQVKQKAKGTINKTGEVVGKTGSEFIEGVGKGIEKTFENEVVFSDDLTASGLKPGKMTTKGTDSTTDNILIAYLIFDKDFNRTIHVKVFDKKGQEYGRTRLSIKNKSGEAGYYDFVFDNRTNIDGKGKIVFE